MNPLLRNFYANPSAACASRFAPRISWRNVLLGALLSFGATLAPAMAQMKVEISGVGATQFPIAVADFAGEFASPASAQSSLPAGRAVADIIRNDLTRSGMFRSIDPAGAVLSETSTVNFSQWKSRGADAITVGSVQRLADGRYDVRFRLLDSVKQAQIDGVAFTAGANELRLTAHRIADRIYEKLTGEKGVFSTRIAYVLKLGKIYELQIADSDGQGAQTALRSREPIISPAWSPDGGKLAYVSFESRKPVVYVHSLASGQRTPVANFKGNNSAPAWSPDGRQLAVVLSRDGQSQIYLMNADGSGLHRILQSPGIDTEPQFAPDGQSLYFTSDRGGSPQVYRASLAGGDVKRVTFNGDYNISPSLSPDGKLLAYLARRGGRFQIAALDLNGGSEILLTEGNRDESPSFAPNGKMVLYATESGGRDVLATVSVDGRLRQTLSILSGEVREPTWGPFGR